MHYILGDSYRDKNVEDNGKKEGLSRLTIYFCIGLSYALVLVYSRETLFIFNCIAILLFWNRGLIYLNDVHDSRCN